MISIGTMTLEFDTNERVRPELSMGLVDQWVGLGWVDPWVGLGQVGPMDNSE